MQTPLDVGAQVEMTLDRPATGGAIGRSASGQVVFVRLGLPAERVRVAITESNRSFARGEVLDVLAASPDRVEPPCAYAHPLRCGGCDLQQATQDAQLEWKSAVASEHFARIAGVQWRVEVSVVDDDARGSRTRVRCGVGETGQLGLRRHASHDVIEIDECWLGDPRLRPAYDVRWTNAVEVELRAIGDGEPFAVKQWPQARPTIYETTSLDGEPLANAVSDVKVSGHDFRVGPLSFWQSHRRAPTLLTATVIELAQLSEGDRVVDLFSGVGLFSVPMATRVGPRGRVVAIEGSREACDDAEHNAAQLRQISVRNWRVSPRAINDSVAANDLVVLDPPRTGAGKAVIAALAARRPRRVVYVSCDAATMARDVRVALDAGYELRELRGFDLFPMTEHVELVGVLDAPH